MDNNINWTQEQMFEVLLKEPDDFLKIRETLSRIEYLLEKKGNYINLIHILHKQNKYYIVHFKELFNFDIKDTNLSENDINKKKYNSQTFE